MCVCVGAFSFYGVVGGGGGLGAAFEFGFEPRFPTPISTVAITTYPLPAVANEQAHETPELGRLFF